MLLRGGWTQSREVRKNAIIVKRNARMSIESKIAVDETGE